MKIMIKAGVLAVLLGMAVAHAADFKVGVVDTERVLRESAPALMAESKIEKEFSGRDQGNQEADEAGKRAASFA